MPLNKSLGRRLQNIAVQRPVKRERNLHRVDVGSLRIEQRMEQQPLLQRRQRQNVLNLRVLALQPALSACESETNGRSEVVALSVVFGTALATAARPQLCDAGIPPAA